MVEGYRYSPMEQSAAQGLPGYIGTRTSVLVLPVPASIRERHQVRYERHWSDNLPLA